MKTTFDTDTILYQMLSEATALTSAITGGVYAGERPDNSQLEDVVVNTIDITQQNFPQIGTSNINIHVPDLKVNIGGTQQMKQNRQRMKVLTDIVLSIVREANIEGLTAVPEGQAVIPEVGVNQHYVNIRINWYIIN